MSDARPTVLAVVVATDGAETLPRTLASLDAQDYPDLEVVGVDNGSTDASRGLLLAELGPDHVLVADRDLGFGGAVGMALDAEVGRGTSHVLLVHDDVELRPDAVSQLVAAMEADEDLAVVGCKLVEWDDQRQLQAVGMSVDVTGRADPGVEPDELDQGQRDHEDRTLYVSTAGMLLDRERFEQLGRFDHRYHLFRDDLDLCWRAWLRGWTVEVVPGAVAAHEASASTYRRLGQTAFLGPRYFAERNTLATLLKNYGPLRLLYVVPLFLLVGVAKVLGFLATRRMGDAWQTVRAWVWNALHLRETWRLRHRVQAARVRTDRELQPLFAQVSARLRAYAEALGEFLSGSSDEIALLEDDGPIAPEPTFTQRVRTTVRTSPVGIAAIVLLVLGAIVAAPLVDRAPLVGGELAPWPTGIWSLLAGYVRPWTVGDLPAVVDVDPAQVLLVPASALGLGAAWAAPKVLVLALVPVAWVATLRAGRLVTHRRLARVAAATLFALSPPMLAALRTGRVGAAAAAALLPLVAIAGARAVLPDVPQDRAWRAVAAAALAAAATIAFEPATGAPLLVGAAVGAAAIVLGTSGNVPARLIRLGLVVVGTGVLLAPWLPRLRAAWEPATAGSHAALGRLLLLTPDLPGFPGLLPGTGLAAAALLGIALAVRRAGQAAGLATVYLAGVGVAWIAVRTGGPAGLWPGTPLLVAALAAAGLLALAFSLAEDALAEHEFGWRQVAAAGAGLLVVLGVASAALDVGGNAWDGYTSEPEVLPAFFATEALPEAVGPFHTLVLDDRESHVAWAITDADGPSMASWGHVMDGAVSARLAALVDALVEGEDPAAAAALGHLGIRYVVVPPSGLTDELATTLRRQLDLVDQPVTDGLVLRVTTWLPRWSVVPTTAADALATGHPLPGDTAVVPLEERATSTSGLLVLAEPTGPDVPFRVTVDGTTVEPTVQGALATWDVGPGVVEVEHTGARGRLLLVALQGLLATLALSLSLRAPRFARRAAQGEQA